MHGHAWYGMACRTCMTKPLGLGGKQRLSMILTPRVTLAVGSPTTLRCVDPEAFTAGAAAVEVRWGEVR